MQTFATSQKSLLFLALVTLLAACTDEVAPTPQVHANETLLLAHGWVIRSIEKDSVNQTTNLFATYALCDRDDIYTFANDGAYTITGGATRCHPDDADIRVSGTWRWDAGILLLQPDEPNEIAFSVTKITDEELVIQQIEAANGQVLSVTTWRFHSTLRL